MAIDMDKMQKTFDDGQRKSPFLAIEQGETWLYIHPPCRPEDEHELTAGLNFLPCSIHYAGNDDNFTNVMCLDFEENPILGHPVIKELLAERGIKLKEKQGCPVCKAIRSGESEWDPKEIRPVRRYIWGVTPIQYSKVKGKKPVPMPVEPAPLNASKTVTDQLMKLFLEYGDLTNAREAVLVRLTRSGEKKHTKWEVSIDPMSSKKPVKLPKETRIAIKEAMKEGCQCDLFKIFASQVKDYRAAEAAFLGVSVRGDEGGTVETEDGVEDKGCFGLDFDADADQCEDCDVAKECAKKVKAAAGKKDKSGKSGKGKKKSEPEPEPEVDDAEDDAEEEDEEGKVPEDEDGDDEDGDGDDEDGDDEDGDGDGDDEDGDGDGDDEDGDGDDEDEDKPKPKPAGKADKVGKKAGKPAGKKPAPEPEEDDSEDDGDSDDADLDADDIEAEAERLEKELASMAGKKATDPKAKKTGKK